MQRTMLVYQCATVYADYFMLREGDFDRVACQEIILWLAVSRHINGARSHEVIGVSGREPTTLFIEDRIRKGEFDEVEGFTFGVAKHSQFCPHLEQLLEVRVIDIAAAGEENHIVGSQTAECVDMGIGVITLQPAMIEPKEMVDAQLCFQFVGNFIDGLVAVAIGRQEALGGGEKCSLSIRFERATFEDKTAAITIHIFRHNAGIAKMKIDQIVMAGCKLQPPTVKAEIYGTHSVVAHHSDGTIIASPGIVGGHFDKLNSMEGAIGETCLSLLDVRHEQQHLFAMRDESSDKPSILVDSLREDIIPISVCMRESQQDAPLQLPLRYVMYIISHDKVVITRSKVIKISGEINTKQDIATNQMQI